MSRTPPNRENRTVATTRRDPGKRHQLRIARDTLRMPHAIAAVMGGPSKDQACEIIRRLQDSGAGLNQRLAVIDGSGIPEQAHEAKAIKAELEQRAAAVRERDQ